MPPRIRLLYSGLCIVLLVIAALPVYRELARPRDIWWTPRAMLVPLPESADRVEVFVRGEPLGTLLEAGRVEIVASGDIGLRFNSRDRLRAESLPALLASAAASGMVVLLLLLVVTGRLVYRGEPSGAGVRPG